MYRVNFGWERGGEFQFDDAAQLQKFINEQFERWQDWIDEIQRSNKDNDLAMMPTSMDTSFLVDPWLKHIDDINPDAANGILSVARHDRNLIPYDSVVGELLREIFGIYGFKNLRVVHEIYTDAPGTREPDGGRIFEIRNLDAIELLSERMRAAYLRQVEENIPSDDMSGVAVRALGILSGMEESYSKLINEAQVNNESIVQISTRVVHLEKELNDKHKEFGQKIINDVQSSLSQREEFREEFERFKDAHAEYARIHSSVVLWNNRKTEFEKAAKKNIAAAQKVGIIGLLAGLGWSIGSYFLAGGLFESSLVGSLPQGDSAMRLSPIFHFRLIFTAVSTLIYLTMYLWIMRLIIRSYLAHEHLRIDAMGRSSMAETYIALINENGANADADRAIVLASLFRPTVDGLVKDDGPPAISLPAFLAGVAQGRN